MGTDTVKQNLAGIDAKMIPLGDFGVCIQRDEITGNVDNRPAAGTNKMRMRLNISVVPLLPVYRTDADDGTVIFKLRDIAVNGAQTQIRIFGL